MKSVNSRLLLRYALLNVAISSALVLLIYCTGGYIEGILHYIGFVLGAPGFFILFFVVGPNNAVHFTGYTTYLFVDFMFYSFVIAIVQVVCIKIKLNRI